MKYLLLLGALLLFPILTEAQSPKVRQFYRQQPRGEGTTKVFLPGWLIKFGVGVMSKQLGEHKAIAKAAAKPMRNLRALRNGTI